MRVNSGLIRSVAVLVALGWLSAPAGAQETGGSVAGTVLDQQKAALPGVTVTLRNEGTNEEISSVTNEEGAFVLPFVPIGRYTLIAALQGFATHKRADIEVNVGDRHRIDVSLQVGALTEEVTVAGGTPLLETASALRGQVINRDQVQDLPLLGRNPFSLAQLSPGVQYTPALASRSNRPFDNGGMDNFQISGSRGFTNEFLLDGVPNTGTETNQPNNLSFVPSPDATAEFKVQTSIYDAQYRADRRRSGQRRGKERHEPVPRRGLRVLPRREAQREHLRRESWRSVQGGALLEPARPGARRSGQGARPLRRP